LPAVGFAGGRRRWPSASCPAHLGSEEEDDAAKGRKKGSKKKRKKRKKKKRKMKKRCKQTN